ncbi:MAG: hypothetical protein IT379_08170 [Deltaproteobacteria bacterium]|nr:hypothetical protein [Deltaproteobacteria bacterium]
MSVVPSSVVTAVAASTAAGKNPWLPFGVIFLLAAPESIPGWLMDTRLHRELHALLPASVLWSLGGVFIVLAALDSLADKIAIVERWLVPVSTAWRPFAGIAVSSLIALGAAGVANSAPADATALAVTADVVQADVLASTLLGGSVAVVSVVAGAIYGWLATIGKTGTRLLLSLVPLPSIRLAHSFLDDVFAVVVLFAGIAWANQPIVIAAALLYLLVGLFTGPLLARLTWIHVRIGWGLVRKGWRKLRKAPPAPAPRPPKWLAAQLADKGIDPRDVTVVPSYAYRVPEIGWCRAGWLVLAPDAVWFATRSMWRPRILALAEGRLARIGLAETVSGRVVTLVERTEGGGLREVSVYLFPAEEAEIVPALEKGASAARFVRVRADSESARRGLPGYAQRAASVRYLPAEDAGSLRAQALTTIVGALVIGVLSGGVFIPIGLGYLLSPYKRRFALGFAFSLYLGICVVSTMFVGWPIAVFYATLLNIVALRDLARLALKARIDGFVDKRALLPAVCDRVWVPSPGLVTPSDEWRPGDRTLMTDGSWRAVVRLLAEPAAATDAEPAGAIEAA